MKNALKSRNILNSEGKLTDEGWIKLKKMDEEAVYGLIISMDREINHMIQYGLKIIGYPAYIGTPESEELKDRIICKMLEVYYKDFKIELYIEYIE